MTTVPDNRPVVVVAGARPNFIKVVPILRELTRQGVPHLFVHTGQHYDERMSDALLTDLEAPAPNIHLGVGSASHAVQTARVMERFEPVLLDHHPSWLVVVGDVNSTLACALVAVKLRYTIGCQIAHVEAGLRSGDWSMPEEVNRVLTDRVSDLLLIPSEDARKNLANEGLNGGHIEFVGNVMIDSLLQILPRARDLGTPERLGLAPGSYAVVTLHRPTNVDDAVQLEAILTALVRISESRRVVFPMHPRTRNRIQDGRTSALLDKLLVTEPLGYTELVSLIDGACVVVTDSGGLQEETTVLGVPCVTVREQTERPITVTHGTNRLVPWPLTTDGVVREVEAAVKRGRVAVGSKAPDRWDGHAAERIVGALRRTSCRAGESGH